MSIALATKKQLKRNMINARLVIQLREYSNANAGRFIFVVNNAEIKIKII